MPGNVDAMCHATNRCAVQGQQGQKDEKPLGVMQKKLMADPGLPVASVRLTGDKGGRRREGYGHTKARFPSTSFCSLCCFRLPNKSLPP